ncbi:MAG TPA: hypothetical protein VME43_04380, partial [Bryobacteraceae bacterium]|nr:hypothetical protein [Bryobacteraceae bacterium]
GQAAERAQGAQRVAIEAQAQQLRQKQFDATYGSLLGPNGEQLTPEAQKAMAAADPVAVAVANYQVPPPNTGSRSPMALATLRKVMALNPDYNAQNWQAQSAMMKGYTSGSQSKEISGINTALGHIGVLGQAIDALNNNDIQGLNRLANFLQVQTGGTAVTTYQAIVHKVAPELNRAYVGGVGAQGEIQAQESDFDPKLGPQQLKNNVAITARLLRSKIGALENQWKTTMGPNSDFQGRFIMPEAQVINRYSPAPAAGGRNPGDAAGFKVTDPRGVVHTFPTQQAADAFKKAAGIQ